MQTITSHKKLEHPIIKWREYLELTKPRVVAMLLLTAVVGMCLSTQNALPVWTLIPALAGIGLMSAAAAAINHLVDRHIDAKWREPYVVRYHKEVSHQRVY